MGKLIINDELRAKLDGIASGTEFCDASGCQLGYFVSPADYEELVYARIREQVTEEELIELRKQIGGRTLQEILTSLEKR